MKTEIQSRKNLFKSSVSRYTLAGILFGCLFPVISTLIDSFLHYGDFSLSHLLAAQNSNPLLWVIDTAPFFLGLFARFAGIRQEKVNKVLENLQEAHIQIQNEAKRSKKITKELRRKSAIIQDDLNTAKTFQESFLPEIPDFPPLEIYYSYVPIATVGGDFLSMTTLGHKSLSLFLGDVSGHGVSAALITSVALVIIQRLEEKHSYSPDKFLSELNTELLKFIPNNKFITAIYGVFVKKHDSVTFTFSRAGHPYPILWKKEEQTLESIKSPGPIVGAIPNASFSKHSISLKPGDRIFFYTDGVLEAINSNNEELGEEGLISILHEINRLDGPLQETVETIIGKFDDFSKNGGKEKDDKVFIGIEAT